MKKTPILRYLAFWLTTLLVFCLLQIAFLPRGEVLRWRNFYALPRNTVDVVFLGTSHAYHSFNPEVIDDILPITSHSLGIPGDNIQIVYHEIRSILRSQQPDLILVDAFSLSMSNWLDGPYIYRFLNASFAPPNIISAADILFKNDYDWWNYFPLIRNNQDWKNLDKLMSNPVSNTPPEYPENPQGHAPLTTIITDADYAAIPMEDFLPLPEHYLTYLQKVIDTTRKENVQLAFVDTLWKGFENPFYDLYDRSKEFRLLSKEAIPYYDFRTYPLAYDWSQIHMYDRDHPSEFGSLIISVRTAELISTMLGLPIDQQKLAWYQNFYFDEFSLVQDADQITLSLVPANPAAPLYYRWQLLAWDEASPLSEAIFTDEPFVTLETPAPGSYRIAVAITQPGGDYELEGRFALFITEP